MVESKISDRPPIITIFRMGSLSKVDRSIVKPIYFLKSKFPVSSFVMIPGEVMKTRNLAVIIYKEDDLYIAECPEIGTVDQGETIEAAIEGLKIATQLYLESFPMPETSPRFVTNIEVNYAEVA